MDPAVLAQLESMAARAEEAEEKGLEADPDTVKRWVELFGFTEEEAMQRIEQHRARYLLDPIVTANEWEETISKIAPEGYDREAYEFLVIYGREQARTATGASTLKKTPKTAMYLVKLDGPLETPEVVRQLGRMASTPRVVSAVKRKIDDDFVDFGHQDRRQQQFCVIDRHARIAIQEALLKQKIIFRPMFVQITLARKELDPHSLAPFLGLDATLPQYRVSTTQEALKPSQSQYPVWYFVYGLLSESYHLRWLLNIPEGEEVPYRPAVVHGGRYLDGEKRYYLSDAPTTYGNAPVAEGKAFLVTDEQTEWSFRTFATHQWEVVRCDIELVDSKEVVRGLTFRFVGKQVPAEPTTLNESSALSPVQEHPLS